MLYMLIQYKDPTNSVRRGPYQKQADGSWKKLKDPADKGGDDNVYYEDKWAMLWPTNEATAKQFDKEGCAMACHEGQTKPYGNKYTNTPGQIAGHVAHEGPAHRRRWASSTTSTPTTRAMTPRPPRTPAARATPARRAASTPISRWSTASRQFMGRDAKAANAGGTYYIKKGDEVRVRRQQVQGWRRGGLDHHQPADRNRPR